MSGDSYQAICGYGASSVASTAGLINPEDGDPINLGAMVALRGDSVDTATNFDAIDRTGNGHTFRQATVADKPTIVSPAGLNAQPAFLFDGVSDFLASTEAASVWEFITDGTGFTVYMTILPLVVGSAIRYLSNYTSGANTGVNLGNDATGTLRYQIFNNAGSFVVDANSGGAAFVLNFGCSFLCSYTEGASPEVIASTGCGRHVINSGASLVAPGTATPAATMNIGRRANGSSFANFYMADMAIWNRALTAAEQTALGIYTLNRYRVI